MTGHEQDILQPSARQTPSPTHSQHPQIPAIKHLGHRRRDSDTLRNVSPSLSSPTAVEPLPRVSPSSRGRISPSSRLAPVSAKHKRSPTAPEPATNGVRLKHVMSSLGKSEDAGSSDREHEKVKAQMAFEAQQRCQQASSQPHPSQAQLNRHIVVSNRPCHRHYFLSPLR
jgi:serine/threonine-protein kinase TTK/MPS1